MDSSPGSPYASSPEPPPRRGGPLVRSPGPEDKERSTFVRLLVSNSAAGCIIGKGGSTITEFQTQSGTRIQLSRNNEFFPGTSDRIIMISGAFDEIIKAMELIHEKLLNDAEESIDVPSQRKDSSDIDNRSKMRLVVPNGCCGCIIGKAGATIKSFIDDSQAGIKISPQDQRYIGLNDRIVTLTGSLQQQIRAFVLILSKLTEDPHYSHTVNTPYPYTGVSLSGMHGVPVGYMYPPVAYNTMNYGSNGVGGKLPINKLQARRSNGGSQEGHMNSVTIGVADEHIGAVVGRGGRNIMEISQTSGARIKISDRGDFMTGTSDRKVTITGSNEAIRAAEDMIMRRISSNYDSP